MILWELFLVFIKLGLFSFGGGYVTIPLLKSEIQAHSWVEMEEFADLVAVSQMTPGPIGINAATYIGARSGGLIGAFLATLGIVLPSFILIIIIAEFFTKYNENRIIQNILKGIRPVTIGLIGSAVLFFAEMSIFTKRLPFENIKNIFLLRPVNFFDGLGIVPGAAIIFIIIIIGTKKFKLNPIFAVIISAILGILIV